MLELALAALMLLVSLLCVSVLLERNSIVGIGNVGAIGVEVEIVLDGGGVSISTGDIRVGVGAVICGVIGGIVAIGDAKVIGVGAEIGFVIVIESGGVNDHGGGGIDDGVGTNVITGVVGGGGNGTNMSTGVLVLLAVLT